MGLFDRFRRRSPTPEQAAKLARITNPRQREILLDCIHRGEHIPDFAWAPLREFTAEQARLLEPLRQQIQETAARRGTPAHELIASLPPHEFNALLPPGMQNRVPDSTHQSRVEQEDPGLAAVRFVRETLSVDDEWATPIDRGFAWWSGPFRQRVWADPPRELDGLLTSRVHARTDLVDGVDWDEPVLTALMSLAMQATLWGFRRGDGPPGRLEMASSVNLHAQSLEWAKRIISSAAGVQTGESAVVGIGLARPLVEVTPTVQPAFSEHPIRGRRTTPDEMAGVVDTYMIPLGRGIPSRCTRDDIAFAADRVREDLGLRVRHSKTALSLTLDLGDVPTHLLADAAASHPKFGAGVLILLQGVRRADIGRGVRTILDLNAMDVSIDAPIHGIGSWCLTPEETLAYATFIPNAAYHRDIFVNLFMATTNRALWVDQALPAS